MIAIIDYGSGNLRSVQKAFQKIGHEAIITNDCKQILLASHVVLPGVGAFKDAMNDIKSHKLDVVVKSVIERGTPFLGICLGMQMLFDSSTEDGISDGMSIIHGDITKFDIKLKVPHTGWNRVVPSRDSRLYDGIGEQYFYFVHSFYLEGNNSAVNAKCDYEISFGCSIEHGKVYGVQFHPEKSGDVGLKLLDNFAKM